MRNVLLALLLLGQTPAVPPPVLPAVATKKLGASIAASRAHARHTWRDTPPVNPDGTINGYIEIPRGERRKFEFDMRQNRRAIDRVMPPLYRRVSGQLRLRSTDHLLRRRPFRYPGARPGGEGGTIIRGTIVGLMHMEDEKGLDSKVVVSPVGPDGRPLFPLTESDRQRIGDYFKIYKKHEPGKFSRVPGWGTPDEGRAYVDMTHAFFLKCRDKGSAACKL